MYMYTKLRHLSKTKQNKISNMEYNQKPSKWFHFHWIKCHVYFFFFTWTKTEFHAYNMQISLFSKETVVKKDTTDLFKLLQNKQKTTKHFDWRHGTLNKYTHVSCKYEIMENCAHWSSEYLVVIQRTVFVPELVWLQQVLRLAGIVAS